MTQAGEDQHILVMTNGLFSLDGESMSSISLSGRQTADLRTIFKYKQKYHQKKLLNNYANN